MLSPATRKLEFTGEMLSGMPNMLQVPTLSDSLCGACHTAAALLSSQHSEVAKKTVGGEKYLFSFTSSIYYVCKYFLSSDFDGDFCESQLEFNG